MITTSQSEARPPQKTGKNNTRTAFYDSVPSARVTRSALAIVLGLFGVNLLDLTHYNTHEIYRTYPMIAISETPALLITFGTISVVDLSKRRIIEPSLIAFIGFPFAPLFTCTFTNITKYMSRGILFEMCSRVSCLSFTRESSFKGTLLGWALAKTRFSHIITANRIKPFVGSLPTASSF